MFESSNNVNKDIWRQERIGEIIKAALILNEYSPFLEITLADIARSARFTRSNLYKYFSCREDLYLEILKKELNSWLTDLDLTFSNRPLGIKEFSHLWVDLLIKRRGMLELLSLVFTHLEKKATPSALESWMENFSHVIGKTEDILLKIFPGAERDDLKEFFHTQLAQSIGLTPLLFLNKDQIGSREKYKVASNSSYYREILSHGVESLLAPWV